MTLEKGFVLFAAVYSGKEERAAMIEEAKEYCCNEGYDQSTAAIADTGEQILVRKK